MRDPIVIEPAGFDVEAAWKECHEYVVEKCGGLSHGNGEPNWRACAGADPGCTSCPSCGELYWKWGLLVRCSECHFVFPTDWWPMYSWGVAAAGRGEGHRYWHAARMEHPYYRYGFEHPVDDAWAEHEKIDWPTVLAGADA